MLNQNLGFFKLDSGSRKRKRPTKYYGLQSFLQPGCPISVSGPFRDNVRLFLQECGQLEDYHVEGMPVWCTFLVHENRGFVVPLYTIEEDVKNSFNPLCDHCRCSGWSHHFVSKRKYHFIIPIDSEWNKPVNEGILDLETHILHGLIHCNGFGHLLCINGIEGGSNFICGREVMDLWDRICTTLHTRKISVVDISKKREMDLRLLYGVSYGHTWFGRWGYKFCHGSFGVTKDKYERALEFLSSLELNTIIQDFQYYPTIRTRDITTIICRYRDLSDNQLLTIRDLLRFMLALKFGNPKREIDISPSSSSSSSKSALKEKSGRCRKFSNLAAIIDSRWPKKRLEFVANVVVNALKEKRSENGLRIRGMSRQEVRDAARLHIGDTGLIDYVLKSMNNVIVEGYVVRRAVNPYTRILEYSLEEARSSGPFQMNLATEKHETFLDSDIYTDIAFLYNHIFFDYPDSELIDFAVTSVLNGKSFVKEWPFNDDADEFLRYICRFVPLVDTLEMGLCTRKNVIGELVVVPLHATVRDLKIATEEALRDTYIAMERLKVRDIEELDGLDDEEVIFGALESGSEISVQGFGVDLFRTSDLNYEGGADNWVVNCKCGARDDDGERMVACDICEVWQHTRCSGIDDADAVPPLFMCYRCCESIGPQNYPKQNGAAEFPDWMMLPVLVDSDIGLSY